MKKVTSLLLLGVLLMPLSEISAQNFRYGLNAGYSRVKYSFPVDRDRYHTADIAPVGAFKAGASVQYLLTKSFRIGTGLEYMTINGSVDGGHIERSLTNPNSEGQMLFEVKNSFITLPVGFQVLIRPDESVRPFLSGGMNFYKALKQNIGIYITPDDPDPFYEEVSTTIDKDTESSYFGARLGVGVAFSTLGDHELSLVVNRHFNTSRYELSDPVNGVFEKHEIRFNTWELALAWTFQ